MTKAVNQAKNSGTLEKTSKFNTSKIKSTVVNQAEIKKITNSPSYRSRLAISPRTGKAYFYFRHHGQQLEGWLIKDYDCSGLNRSRSYTIETPNGQEEFFCSQYLHKVIEKYKLQGEYVRITYIGDQQTGYGHARKVYQVEKLAVKSRDSVSAQTEPLPEQKGKKNVRRTG